MAAPPPADAATATPATLTVALGLRLAGHARARTGGSGWARSGDKGGPSLDFSAARAGLFRRLRFRSLLPGQGRPLATRLVSGDRRERRETMDCLRTRNLEPRHPRARGRVGPGGGDAMPTGSPADLLISGCRRSTNSSAKSHPRPRHRGPAARGRTRPLRRGQLREEATPPTSQPHTSTQRRFPVSRAY